MIQIILFLIFSLVLIIAGANYLTDGAMVVARRAKVSELVIGLTIVAIGTSMPELVVSVLSAVNGNSEIALGNVIGSNVFNGLVIVGVVALLSPFALDKNTTFKNMSLCLGVSVLLLLMCASVFGCDFMPSRITRFGGLILLLCFVLFLYSTVSSGKVDDSDCQEDELKQVPLGKAILFILLGIGGLVWGGSLFLRNAVDLAKNLGVSEYVISVTIVAFGTSAPELATSVVAALKGRSGLAIGNVLGSNISNILLVIGAASAISPLSLAGITPVDISVLVVSAMLLFASAYVFTRFRVSRFEGTVLLLAYVAYIVYLI